mgnify:CR=1 FL=1
MRQFLHSTYDYGHIISSARDQKVFLFKGLSGVFILLLACGLIFNKEIERRINSLKADVISYAQKITVNPRSEHVLQWLTQELKEVLMV